MKSAPRSSWARRLRRWALLPAGCALVLAIAVLRPYPTTDLVPRASLKIVDRDGNVLRRTAAPSGGKQLWVSLSEIPPIFTTLLVEAEDKNFFRHYGVDPAAMGRATWLNLWRGAWDFGGSTLTMQTVRLIKPHPRTVLRKLLEMIDAVRLERAATKQQILEQHINRAYFGHGATGLEAAAWRYFGHAANRLTRAEATLLAVVIRGPRVYDLVAHLDVVEARRDLLLARLVDNGELTSAERDAILADEVLVRPAAPPSDTIPIAGHFVDWVMTQLPAGVVERGGTIRTSLELPLQRQCERLVAQHLEANAERGIGQAGLVVLDVKTGSVRAMVGSRDYMDPEGGMINILTTPRSPGSSLKPFTYALALENGATPATIANDLIRAEGRHNADGREHGPVRYAVALPSSYNLAALDVARRVGPERLLERLRTAGLDTLTGDAEEYGIGLTLGSGKVKLLDLAAAYRFLVGEGLVIRANPGLRIEPAAGTAYRPPRKTIALFDPVASYLTMDMLSQAPARRAAFGDDLPVDLGEDNASLRVVAKTGTSGGFADNVAVIASQDTIVLAWAGNFDGQAMHKMLAMWGAMPLARRALLAAQPIHTIGLPPPPPEVATRSICALSGDAPGPRCPHSRALLRRDYQQQPCTWHRADGTIAWPAEHAAWAERVRRAGGRISVDAN